MGITLRGAFIISAVIHAGLFAPFYNQYLLQQELEKKNTIVVDYVVLKEIAIAIATNKEVVLNLDVRWPYLVFNLVEGPSIENISPFDGDYFPLPKRPRGKEAAAVDLGMLEDGDQNQQNQRDPA